VGRRSKSDWAFGFNRRIGSVCLVDVKFDFHKSATDRCSIERKTDEFGFLVPPSQPKLALRRKNR
jgi:hypothetical protein